MLPDFTGVLAVKQPYFTGTEYMYRPYVSGRRINAWDAGTRKGAESELADELDRLAEVEDPDDDA